MNSKSPTSQITVAASYISSLLDYCENKLGKDVYRSISFIDINELRAPNVSRRVDAFLYNRVLESVSNEYNLPLLGFEFGKQIGAKAFNLLGYLTMSSNSLGEAANALQRYNKLVSNMGASKIYFDGERGFAEWHDKPAIKNFSYHVIDAVLAGWCSFSRKIVNKNLPLLQVELSHNNSYLKEEYQSFYGCNVKFNSQCNRLTFKKEWFDLPVLESEETVYQAVVSQADIALAQIEDGNFPDNQQIIQSIVTCLPSGDFGINNIAKKFGVSERTFQRRLSERHVSFRELLEEAKKLLALELMKKNELSLSAISGLLGFAEQSAFTRAFKKWTGQTPKQFQKTMI